MNNKHASNKLEVRNYEELDANYKLLVHEFIETQKNKTNILYILTILYKELRTDYSLISKKDGSLIINKITLNKILEFQDFIEAQVIDKKISIGEGQEILFIISKFLKFFFKKNLVSIFYKPLKLISPNILYLKKTLPPILLEFSEYLTTKDYTHTYKYMNSTENFLKFSSYEQHNNYTFQYWQDSIKNYENDLQHKVIKELLSSTTAYKYLGHIKVFFNFLYYKKIINFKYNIPPKMRHHSKRSNEYVHVKDIQLVMNTIIETSNDVLRDLTIYLLLVETGCRSIEIANLTVTDINTKERIIKLKSKKSKQRTLILSIPLTELLVDYLKIRKNYLPKNNTPALYLNSIGNQIIPKTITKFIRKYNLKTFGEIIFSAKTCRHTYITNALNNANVFENVSNTVGHKHLKSTLYYYYRDISAIKKIGNQKHLNYLEES